MPEISPPSYEQNACHTAQSDRLIWSSIICAEGVAAAGDLLVSAGGGMTVDVAAGSAFIQGDTVADQGMYHAVSDSVVNRTIASADPTDDRIDLVVAQVNDSQYVGTSDDWEIVVITGAPSPSPSAPGAPDSALPLAEVTVTAGAASIAAGDINNVAPERIICANGDDTGWVSSGFTFASGWNPGGVTPEVRRIGNQVWVRGRFTKDTDIPESTTYELVSRLPLGFRPLTFTYGFSLTGGFGAHFQGTINTGGQLEIRMSTAPQAATGLPRSVDADNITFLMD